MKNWHACFPNLTEQIWGRCMLCTCFSHFGVWSNHTIIIHDNHLPTFFYCFFKTFEYSITPSPKFFPLTRRYSTNHACGQRCLFDVPWVRWCWWVAPDPAPQSFPLSRIFEFVIFIKVVTWLNFFCFGVLATVQEVVALFWDADRFEQYSSTTGIVD